MRDVKEPEVRKAEIMDAAIRLFTRKGYLNTTTQDIIDEVNISRGLLYYHFKNKEDILYCVIERYSQPLLKRLEHLAYEEDKGAEEKVRLFMEFTLVKGQDVTAENFVLQEAADLDENRYMLDRFYHKLCGSVAEYFAHIIEQGNREGVFHVASPGETASFLMTGYIFVSNDARLVCQSREQLQGYLDAYKILLERALGTVKPLFSEK